MDHLGRVGGRLGIEYDQNNSVITEMVVKALDSNINKEATTRCQCVIAWFSVSQKDRGRALDLLLCFRSWKIDI